MVSSSKMLNGSSLTQKLICADRCGGGSCGGGTCGTLKGSVGSGSVLFIAASTRKGRPQRRSAPLATAQAPDARNLGARGTDAGNCFRYRLDRHHHVKCVGVQ